MNIIGVNRINISFIQSIIDHYGPSEQCIEALRDLDVFRNVDIGTIDNVVTLVVEESGKLVVRTGTEISGREAIVYVKGMARNLFGRAEKLIVDAKWGSRGSSAIEATIRKPIPCSDLKAVELSVFRNIPLEMGGRIATDIHNHNLGIIHRVCASASTSTKSLKHNWLWENKGLSLRGLNEVSDRCGKLTVDAQYKLDLKYGVSAVISGLYGGLMTWSGREIHDTDRFTLDVRGFRPGNTGMGTQLVAGSLKIQITIPWLTRHLGVRGHVFINGGQVLLRRIAYGIGLHWGTPSGRMELNLARPLTEGDSMAVQFGFSGSWL